MKALLTRFGGIGDMMPLEVVARQLKKKGYEVIFAVRDDGPKMRLSDVFYKNPSFDKILDFQQIGPWQTRCVKTQFGFCSINALYRDFDLVVDFMNCVENNSTSPFRQNGPDKAWQASRNSNWQNWYDIHLAWAGIDPISIPEDEKRPKLNFVEGEKEMFAKVKGKHSHLFVLQTSASSLSRTWYQGKALPDMLIKKYPEAVVAFWDAPSNIWVMYSKEGASRLEAPEGVSPLRFSMGLVGSADLFVGVDSGFTHVAEGFNIPHIAIYSTVPAWTRNKYYKNQVAIDPGEVNPEFYTFNLGLGDPLRVKEGIANLTVREKQVMDLYEKKAPLEVAMRELNTDREGADLELQTLKAKLASFERLQSKALSTVTPEAVFSKIEEVLNEKN